MTILKHGDTPERVHFVCGNCGCEWKAQERETEIVYHIEKAKNLYFMDCPECGKIRVKGERRNKHDFYQRKNT